jgi:hypothetical protein
MVLSTPKQKLPAMAGSFCLDPLLTHEGANF